MADVNGKFMKPLIALYGEHGTDEMDFVLGIYEKILGGFSNEVLDAGFQVLAGTYMPSKRNPWPAPAVCKKACDRVVQEKAAETARMPWKPQYRGWSTEAIRIADELITAAMGRRAAREGWVLGLRDYCRNHRRLPTEMEIREIISVSRFVDRCAAGAVEMGTCHKALQKFANTMASKRENLAMRVLGEAA